MAHAAVDLYWLPLGAGGHFVRFNGRVYEAIAALREHREPLDLYHTALEITVPEGRFVIENAWPIPDADGATRGVAVEGPVGGHHLARFRVFRYGDPLLARWSHLRCRRSGRKPPANLRRREPRASRPRACSERSPPRLGAPPTRRG